MAVSAGVAWAAVVLVTYSLADLFGKKGVMKLGYVRAAALVSTVSMVPFLALYVIFPQAINSQGIVLSAIGGVFYGLGFLLLYKSLVTEQTTNTFALSEFFKAWLVLFSVFILGIALSASKWIGIVLIFAGSFMVITTENLNVNKKLVYALSGFICWAVLWTLMSFAVVGSKPLGIVGSDSYIPEGLIAAFFAAVTAAAAFLVLPNGSAAHRQRSVPHWERYVVTVGLGIGAGSAIFGYLILAGQLAQGASIIALTPIVVAVASRRIYLDRLTAVQLSGVAVAVVGALVLAFAPAL